MTFQPTLFDGSRQTLAEALTLTAESLNAYGPARERWAVAYSGGKDSSALVTSVVHLIETGRVRPPKRLHVLYGDTRMELPPLWLAAQGVMAELRKRDWIDTRVVVAPLDQRFFVYMLGRGVPPPNNKTLRWCTAQIKVEPMEAELRRLAEESPGKVLMLIGVRLGESAARDARIALACSRNGAECGQGWYQRDLPEAVCDKLSPVLHWRTCLVWDWLMFGTGSRGPSPAMDLVAKVREGVLTKDEAMAELRRRRGPAPDHGFPTREVAWAYGLDADGSEAESGARTGCVGCPLATRETALDNLVARSEWSHLAPLKELRPLYRELREARNRLRQPPGERRKDGSLTSNQNRMGPLTMSARLDALERIVGVQARVNSEARRLGRSEIDILNAEEEARIRELIATNTWPQKWKGDEPAADLPYVAVNADGTRQMLLDALAVDPGKAVA